MKINIHYSIIYYSMPNLCSNDTFELNSILKVRLKEQIPIFQLAPPQILVLISSIFLTPHQMRNITLEC